MLIFFATHNLLLVGCTISTKEMHAAHGLYITVTYQH